MSVFDNVKKVKRPLIIFCHGLGDAVNFIPVFEEFCKQTGKKITLGVEAKRQFRLLYPKAVLIDDVNKTKRKYDYIYRVHYPEPKTAMLSAEHNDESAKPLICAYDELGMKPFTWKKANFGNCAFDSANKKVGVHFFGHTSNSIKTCPREYLELIWSEIKNAGYHPFEIHMKPQFAKEYSDVPDDYFPLVNKNNSLRFIKPDLLKMINALKKCRFFIGVDSGPLYLAHALLGQHRVIALENLKHVNNYIPVHINAISTKYYKMGRVTKTLKLLERNNG